MSFLFPEPCTPAIYKEPFSPRARFIPECSGIPDVMGAELLQRSISASNEESIHTGMMLRQPAGAFGFRDWRAGPIVLTLCSGSHRHKSLLNRQPGGIFKR